MSEQSLANNPLLTLVARFAMILAAAALPIAGWMIQRGVNSVDLISERIDKNSTELNRKVDAIKDQSTETGSNVKLIQQTQQVQGAVISDHETRVRLLEGRPK